MVLELCRSPADVRTIQTHLDRMQIPAAAMPEVRRLLMTLGSRVSFFQRGFYYRYLAIGSCVFSGRRC